jgi:His-Xaa-Ser system protein HxsD
MAVEKVVFSSEVFGLEAVKKAAYRFIDRFSIDIILADETIECQLNFADADKSVSFWVDEFKKEVLDQDLRQRIKAESEPVRNLILAHAFSQSTLIEK